MRNDIPQRGHALDNLLVRNGHARRNRMRHWIENAGDSFDNLLLRDGHACRDAV